MQYGKTVGCFEPGINIQCKFSQLTVFNCPSGTDEAIPSSSLTPSISVSIVPISELMNSVDREFIVTNLELKSVE